MNKEKEISATILKHPLIDWFEITDKPSTEKYRTNINGMLVQIFSYTGNAYFTVDGVDIYSNGDASELLSILDKFFADLEAKKRDDKINKIYKALIGINEPGN